jgi:pimeloyl-ACP methyl ester carboxylesterase
MLFQSSHGPIYYKIVGTGKPAVILHGYSLDHRVMSGCLEPVFKHTRGIKRIYVDLPGMGRSNNIHDLTSSHDILKLVDELITFLFPKKHFSLIGYSYGGYLAQCLVASRSEQINGLALIAPVIIPNPRYRKIDKQMRLVAGYMPRRFRSLDEKDVFSELVVRNRDVWEKIKRYILTGMSLANKSVLDKIFRRTYGTHINIFKLKRRFKHPTVIVVGQQDSVVGHRDVKKILKNYSQAKLFVIDHAGHNLMFEQPSLFSQHMEHWLKQL